MMNNIENKEHGGINVLSLFDGMSCGQIALNKLGIKVNHYFASEIDKYAIHETTLNFPDTEEIGDVCTVDVEKLPKIDLLIGGSPCQSFSFIGKRVGMQTTSKEIVDTLDKYLELKKEGFEFAGFSYLFWEYMRILKELRKKNPDILFMLENVEMGEKWEKVISKATGINGVHINSSLVSAQNRKRIYWSNIKTVKIGFPGFSESEISVIPQPEDKGLYIKDILEENPDRKYFIKDQVLINLIKGKIKAVSDKNGFGFSPHNIHEKSGAIVIGGKMVYDTINLSIETLRINSSNINKFILKRLDKNISVNDIDLNMNYISNFFGKERIFTPLERVRLQTVPEWYKWDVSETEQMKMLGNGWTVDVIVHIFRFLKDNPKIKNKIIIKEKDTKTILRNFAEPIVNHSV